MRSLFLLLIVSSVLASCISFPRAQMQARERRAAAAESGDVDGVGEAPVIKTRKDFQERYFR